TPSAVVGVLYAPEDAQIELGASVAWSDTARVDGTIAATATAMGPQIMYPERPHASLAVCQPMAVRAGGRYVGDRMVAELDGDLWIAPGDAESETWLVRGVRIADPS